MPGESTDELKLRSKDTFGSTGFVMRWTHGPRYAKKSYPPITNVIAAGAKNSVSIGSSCAIAKSCLLDRLIYGGEQLRKEICPTHKGQWSGCNISGEKTCECQHDTCITGWLPNPGDPKSQASFRVTLLSNLSRGGQR
jgi:hypothetical protein